MGFLAPWFLGGMLAVGLPLWIHLLRQYRSTPHPFSSLMFFETRTQSSIKHRRLRYLALLALRIALLILMALAFANPFVTRTVAGATGRKSLVFAIDNSFSMRFGDHLARAKQSALDAVSAVRSGGKAQVAAIGSQVRYLTPSTDDPSALRAAIQSVQPGDDRSSFGEFARSLRTLAQDTKGPLEVHFFSDMQKSSMPPAFADLQLGNNTALILESVADGKQPNWVVESVTAPGRIYDPKKVRVQAVVAGIGAAAAHRAVSLVLDNKVLETKQVEVPANGRASVQFLSLDSPYGFHRAEVRIEPGDALHEDDRFPFAVERADPRRVLFLHEGGQNRGELYYRTALEAAPQAGFVLDPLPANQAGNQSLSKYAFVVLSDVGSLPSGFEDNLRRYVGGGGAVLIALGPQSVARQRVPVFDQPISGSRYSTREGDRFQTAGSLDPEHPVLRGTNRLQGVQFFQTINVEPGKEHVIARLTDQTPLLLEKQIGDGRVVVFASTFDNIGNDFPLHSSFLPFIEQTARYLGGQHDRSSNLGVGSFIDLRAAREQAGSVDVIDPDGKHPLSLKEASTAQSFQVTREGFYEIRRGNGRQELVAVHADRRESDLTPIPSETLDLWKNSGRTTNPETSISTGAAEHTQPRSLWRYALFLVLLVALTESFFASKYLSMEKDM
ncbi:MAG: BatA domain-containing protein [Bryobacteraceae bacterium]